MPRVNKSAFECPQCGQQTTVKSTRCVVRQRLIRYRQCPDGHRFTTQETLAELTVPSAKSIGINRIEFALTNLMTELGIQIESTSPNKFIPDTLSHGDPDDDN